MEQSLLPYHAVNSLGPARVLVFAPHPDDEVFGCAGSLARHAAAGDFVQIIVVTDGGHGGGEDPLGYARQRQAESRAAAEVLGYGPPRFWGLPDRGLHYGEALIQRLLAALSEAEADLVYAPSPLEVHPDHWALSLAVLEAVRRHGQGTRLALYEVGVPLHPNVLLDISNLVDRKRQAMACFRSQLVRQPYDLQVEALNCFRTYTLGHEVQAAEAYRVLSGPEVRHDFLGLYAGEYQRRQGLGLGGAPMDRPLVSVVVRSTNRDTLPNTLDSLALQTYPRLEVVVVDAIGAGHRPLPQWCGRFPMRLLGTGGPVRRSRAGNLGLQDSQGTYLLLLDDDDWLDPGHVAGLVDALTHYPSAPAAYAGVRCVQQDGAGAWQEVRRYNEPFDPIWLLVENSLPIHAVLWRSSHTSKDGCRLDETLELFEDWDLWLQLARFGEFIHVDRISANYRIHPGAGTGVVASEEAGRAGLKTLLAKWQPRWSVDQGMQLVARMRLLRTLLRAEQEQRALQSAAESEQRQLWEHQRQLWESKERALEEQIARLTREWSERLRAAEEQLRGLLASRSWRLTAPLRAVSRRLRRAPQAVAFVRRNPLSTTLRRLALGYYRGPWTAWTVGWLPYTWKQQLRRLFLGPSAARPSGVGRGAGERPLVSIIIPIYGHGRFLRQCLESALHQTYPSIEVIAVDDASPQSEVREILASLAGHVGLTVLYNDSNLGISRTQNRALMASYGDIIAFVDCDDYLAADAVECSLRYWSAETVYSHSGRINVDEAGEEVSRISFEHLPRQDYFAENLDAMYATHFKMIRRVAFARVGLFDARFDAAQDYDMLMRIAFQYPSSAFVHPPEFLYFHRLHRRQATETMNSRQLESTAAIQREARLRRDIREGRFDRFISIVMLSFGKSWQTLEALQSLARTVRIPHEVILLDNGSDAETVDFLKQQVEGHFANVRVLYSASNLGPAVGRREALRHAKGEWFIVFDNDEVAEPDWIENLLVRAVSRPDVGAVCCKVIFPNGRLQFSGGRINPLDEELVQLDLYDRDYDTYDLETAQFRDCDWCPIGATLFTLNPGAFLHAGYPNVFEDAGVSMALRRQGKSLLNSPASWVWHHHMNFQRDFSMRERYVRDRYDPLKMLTSVATFFRETGLIIKDEYVWRENGLDRLDRAALRRLLESVAQTGDGGVSSVPTALHRSGDARPVSPSQWAG